MIKVIILGRGGCSFLVKNSKKIRFWKALADRSNPRGYIHSCPTYREVEVNPQK